MVWDVVTKKPSGAVLQLVQPETTPNSPIPHSQRQLRSYHLLPARQRAAAGQPCLEQVLEPRLLAPPPPSTPPPPTIHDFSPLRAAFAAHDARFMAAPVVAAYTASRWVGAELARVTTGADAKSISTLNGEAAYRVLRNLGFSGARLWWDVGAEVQERC